jgi:hypothetical protein
MISSTKRRLVRGIGAGLAAAAFGTVGISAASASSDLAPLAGITVPGDAAAAPATLVASLEGRNEVTAGAPAGQALELIGIQGNTLSYSVSSRGIGTPTEADIHAAGRGLDGRVVVPGRMGCWPPSSICPAPRLCCAPRRRLRCRRVPATAAGRQLAGWRCAGCRRSGAPTSCWVKANEPSAWAVHA